MAVWPQCHQPHLSKCQGNPELQPYPLLDSSHEHCLHRKCGPCWMGSRPREFHCSGCCSSIWGPGPGLDMCSFSLASLPVATGLRTVIQEPQPRQFLAWETALGNSWPVLPLPLFQILLPDAFNGSAPSTLSLTVFLFLVFRSQTLSHSKKEKKGGKEEGRQGGRGAHE